VLHEFVSKRSARADVTLAVDLFAAEHAVRRALSPLLDGFERSISFETQLRARAGTSLATPGFERVLDLTFDSDGEGGATQVGVTAVASPPVDSTRRFRRYRVPRAVAEALQADLHAIRSGLPDAVPVTSAGNSPFRPRAGNRQPDVTLRVPRHRREVVAAARAALATLPAYAETRLSSSTGSIELPGREGSRVLFATLVQQEGVTAVSLLAGSTKPEEREAIQREIDAAGRRLTEATAN
jgi:hypothetical protein